MSFRVAIYVGKNALTSFQVKKKGSSTIYHNLYFNHVASSSWSTEVSIDGISFGSFGGTNPCSFTHEGIDFKSDFYYKSAIIISSQDYDIVNVHGSFYLSGDSYFICNTSSAFIPDMTNYLSNEDIKVLTERLNTLKTEFARLQQKWSKLDGFISSLEDFNRVLNGYRNTLPPSSFLKFNSILSQLKEALKK